MQTVLATLVDKFGSAPMNRPMCRPFLGDGLFTTDGPEWKHSRQMINPLFARSQVSELSSFEKHLEKMIAKIPKDGSTVDLQPLCKILFLDSTTEFIFGKSANSLSPETDDPIARQLPALFDKALTEMFTRYILGRFGFLAVSKKKWLGTCAEVHKIIDPAQQNVLTDVGCIIVRLMQRFKACGNRDKCFEYIDKIVFTRESKNGAKVGLIPV